MGGDGRERTKSSADVEVEAAGPRPSSRGRPPALSLSAVSFKSSQSPRTSTPASAGGESTSKEEELVVKGLWWERKGGERFAVVAKVLESGMWLESTGGREMLHLRLHHIATWKELPSREGAEELGRALELKIMGGPYANRALRLFGSPDKLTSLAEGLKNTCTKLAERLRAQTPPGRPMSRQMSRRLSGLGGRPTSPGGSDFAPSRYAAAVTRRELNRATRAPGDKPSDEEAGGPGSHSLAHSLVQLDDRPPTWIDRALDEVVIFGKGIFDFFTPAEAMRHRRYFCGACVLVTVAVTFYTFDSDENLAQTVDMDALYDFGARSDQHIYVRGEWWRHITSMFPHTDLGHLASNMLLLIAAGLMLEHRYGWYRLAPLYVASGIAGNLYSATFEGCDLVTGASGACFGLVAAIAGDLFTNHDRMTYVYMRWGFVAVNVGLMLLSMLGSGSDNVSHWSHLGGFGAGLFLSLLFLPRLGTDDMEALFGITALFFLCFTYIVLPTNLYGFDPGFAGQPKECMRTCVGKYCCGETCHIGI